MSATALDARPKKVFVYRHTLLVRITHWVNASASPFLILSGLQIFNAHPTLYWGEKSSLRSAAQHDARATAKTASRSARPRSSARPSTRPAFSACRTTAGDRRRAASRTGSTLPTYRDLATGRRWHFFFAWLFVINGLVYLIASVLDRHVWRDLIPTGRVRGIGPLDQRPYAAPLRGEDATTTSCRSSPISAWSWSSLPLLVLTGLTMSPGIDAAFPWLLELFGGRQSARTIHFICATLIVLFVIVHVVMVLISGVGTTSAR